MAVFRKKKPDWQSRTGEDQFHKNWFIQFRVNGKTHFFSSKTTNKTKAEQVERKLRNEMHARTMLGAKERIPLTEAVALYQRSKESSPAYRTYKSVGGKVLGYLADCKFLHDVTTMHVIRMNEQMKRDGKSNQTRITYTHFIRATIKLCTSLDYSARTDVAWPKIGFDPGRDRILTDEEEVALLHELHPARYPYEDILTARQDNYDYVLCMLDTGARPSEIRKLTWAQINLKEQTITLRRTKAARGGYKNVSVIYMSDRVADVFRRRSQDKAHLEFVFPNKAGTKPRSAPSDAFKRACVRAGISNFHIHDMRHSSASRLLRAGFSLYEVSLMLGHSDLRTSARYAAYAEMDVSKRARDIFNKLNTERQRNRLKAV